MIQAEIDRYIVRGEPIQFSKEMLTDEFNLSFKGSVPVLGIMKKEKFKAYFQ
jgi:hypothetical protein